MHLPINISDLLQGSIVESDRIEFKADWNPEKILHTICAFANDFNNYGGGYIVLGVEEQEGKPCYPPRGVDSSRLDKLQKDLLNLCSYLKPSYTPIASMENYQGKDVFVIWAPGGQTRPYSAPVSLSKGCKDYQYYIRKFSSSVVAKNDELKELLTLTATVPFDDRINHNASLHDLKLSLIQSFLHDVGSKLLEESANISFADLCRQMLIVDGGDEYLKPRNVGLLFFNDQPHKFFPYAQIDVVYFPEGEGGDIIEEEIFRGPLHQQLRDTLRYIQNNFISERVIKISGRAEARRFFNYPYDAIEEALVNAVYHRSYEIREPIEVRITPDAIQIVSHPGADSSILLKDVEAGRIKPRRYRNRRIGEFLKELDLTEGRGTGIPKIRRAIQSNGSPEPIFSTDEGRLSFFTEIKIHPEFLKEASVEAPVEAIVRVSAGNIVTNETELKILRLCLRKPVGRKEILAKLGHKSFSGNVKEALKRLKTLNLIDYTIKDKPTSRNQQYKITLKGMDLISRKK